MENKDTWIDEYQLIQNLRITPAYLAAWRRAGWLTCVEGAEGRMYHKKAVAKVLTEHRDSVDRAQAAYQQALVNRTIRQLSFAYSTDK